MEPMGANAVMPMGNTTEISDALRRFGSLTELGDEELDKLAAELEIQHAGQGTELLEFGSQDPRQLFLLLGRIELVALDGARHQVAHQDPAAMGPISCLRPSRYRVTALTDVEYLLIDRQQVTRPSVATPAVVVEEDFLIQEREELISDGATHSLMFDVFHDLNHGRIVVPSHPEIAVKVGRALNPHSEDTAQLANMLALCPALVLKVMRAAINMQPGEQAPRSILDAIDRLGAIPTFDLAVTCVLRESLRTKSELVRRRMESWWHKTVRVASIARTLARSSERFNPDLAELVALLHSIAEPIMLGYASRHADLADEAALDHVIRVNRAQLGRIVLAAWHLPREVVNAAAYCDYWSYDHSREADYTDINLVAQWHAEIGSGSRGHVPTMDQIPAFRRMRMQQSTPATSLQVLERANRDIAAIEARLGG